MIGMKLSVAEADHMDLSRESLRESLVKGNFSAVVALFRSLSEELTSKSALLRVKTAELNNVRQAYQKVEDERDVLKRECAYFRRWFEAHGLSDKLKEIDKRYGSAAQEKEVRAT